MNIIQEPGPVNKDSKIVSLNEVRCYNIIIGLGNHVSSVLEKEGIEHFKIPHPSPLNRKLNDRNYEKQVLEHCKEYLK